MHDGKLNQTKRKTIKGSVKKEWKTNNKEMMQGVETDKACILFICIYDDSWVLTKQW